MNLNPSVTILLKAATINILVSNNAHVWSKDYATPDDAARDAVDARLMTSEDAAAMLKSGRGFMGVPLQYYPLALRKCGFTEYPVEG